MLTGDPSAVPRSENPMKFTLELRIVVFKTLTLGNPLVLIHYLQRHTGTHRADQSAGYVAH